MEKRLANTRPVSLFRALVASLIVAKIIEVSVNALLPGVDLLLRDAFALIMASASYMPFLVFFDRQRNHTEPGKPLALASFHMFF